MKQFMYSPDAGQSAADNLDAKISITTPASTDHLVRHKLLIPNSNIEIANLAIEVSASWKAHPLLTLIWKKQADFEKEAGDFLKAVQVRNTAGGDISPNADSLEDLDDDIDDAIPFIKSYLESKYGKKTSIAHYASFGIEHNKRGYDYPDDRQSRNESLRLTIDAVHENGFDDNQYGNTFWTDIKTRYEVALKASTLGVEVVSSKVSTVNTARQNIRKVLRSILLIIEANYPDTFKSERRTWGFLKESH